MRRLVSALALAALLSGCATQPAITSAPAAGPSPAQVEYSENVLIFGALGFVALGAISGGVAWLIGAPIATAILAAGSGAATGTAVGIGQAATWTSLEGK